jgi:8-hydroxy-5-deazaflavin:NADPH oxidoreductase
LNPLSPDPVVNAEVEVPSEIISILGTGKVGRTLAKRFAALGYQVRVGSRHPEAKCDHPDLSSPNIQVVSQELAISAAPICFLAIPWKSALTVAEQFVPWQGKTLIDCSNPLNSTFDGLELGHHTSAAEEIAQRAVGAHVIKALNTASVEVMNNPDFGGTAATMFFCGDDENAKSSVAQLLSVLGFAPIDCGPLSQARNIEPLAMLYIHLAIRRGFGSHFGFTTLKRSAR